jgi:hypothetical protein
MWDELIDKGNRIEGGGGKGTLPRGKMRGFACLGVAVDRGAEARLFEARVALDPPELRLTRRHRRTL